MAKFPSHHFLVAWHFCTSRKAAGVVLLVEFMPSPYTQLQTGPQCSCSGPSVGAGAIPCFALSGGEQQFAPLARALIGH